MCRCGVAVFWVVCGVCVIRIDVGGALGDVDVLCVAVFFMLRQNSSGGENRLQGDTIKRRIIYIMYSLIC